MKERQLISKAVKDSVRHRQKGKCVCCIEKGTSFHHVYAVAFCKNKIHSFDKNIVLLCKHHHDLFHLGDPDTFQCIYEYVWYLYYGTIPEYKDIMNISNKVLDLIKKDIEMRSQYFL